MKNTEKYAVVVRESALASIIKDSTTFILFAGLLVFNHKVLDGNGWIDAIFILFVFLWLIAQNSKSVFKGTTQDAIKWLQSKESK